MKNQDYKYFRIAGWVATVLYIIFATLLFLTLTTCSARELSCEIWNTYEALLLSIFFPGVIYLIVIISIAIGIDCRQQEG